MYVNTEMFVAMKDSIRETYDRSWMDIISLKMSS